MKCRECHEIIKEDDLYCSFCGAKIIRLCYKCNNTVSNEDLFCNKCGNKLIEPELEYKASFIDNAKILAHQLNNILSIILASSQLALYQIKNPDEKNTDKLQDFLNDIAIYADSSGILIHQFQNYIEAVEKKLVQNSLKISAENIKSHNQTDFSAELKTYRADKNKIRTIRSISTSQKQASILVVDDEDKIRYAMSYAITIGGHNVITAQNGQEALNLIKNQYYDVAFVDLILPDMEGWKIIDAIKQISSNTMIVLMTGWNVNLDNNKLDEGNIDTILTKPFQLFDVTELIKSALEKNKE
jgi:CheY-like chemotaxis protein